MPINKAVRISAAAIDGLGEVCLGNIYKSTLEKKMDWNIILLSQMPSKAQCFWPLQRKCQYELLAKITPNENILLIDLFKANTCLILFFFKSEKKAQTC